MSLLGADLLRLTLFLLSYINQDLSSQLSAMESAQGSKEPHLPTVSPVIVNINDDNLLTSTVCQSLNERYHVFDDQCYELLTQGPCKSNQLFYQNPDSNDEGICDCESSLFIYSTETGDCYKQNSQGPCKDGEWYILIQEGMSPTSPFCQPLPEGCLADGRYVYWSPDEEGSTTDWGNQKQCWRLGTQGPCSNDEVLDRYVTNYIGCQRKSKNNKVSKVHRLMENTIDYDPAVDEEVDRSVARGQIRSCGSGSLRSQTGKCKVAF